MPILTLPLDPDTIRKGIENGADALFLGFFLVVLVLIFLRAVVLKFFSDEISQIEGDF